MIHHLKTKPEYFQAVINGKKPFEIRYNDRNFKTGDRVILEEYIGYKEFGICPDIDSCSLYAYIYDEDEAVSHCPFNRESCGNYGQDIYTGQRCLIQIKEIFNLDNAGKDLIGYVAFTFDIIAINGEKYDKDGE